MKNKNKNKLYGALRAYLRWPMFLTVLLLSMNLCIYMIDRKASVVMSCFVAFYFVIALLLYFVKRPTIIGDMVRFATNYGKIQRKLVKELALPYAVLDCTGRMLWANDEFSDIIGSEKKGKTFDYEYFS